MTDLQIQNIKLSDIRAYKNNPKLHNRAQVAKIRESIREFGFINPVLLDENLEIIAGHGRVAAAQDAGMTDVPAIILSHLTDAQKRAYRIADNKLTELGKWSIELLNLEFSELSNLDLDFNLEITGFETAEIDLILDGDGTTDPKADTVPELTDEDRRCHRGDIWKLGRYIIVCGVVLMTRENNAFKYYLLEVVRGKWEMPELIRQVMTLYYKWRYEKGGGGLVKLLIEDKASGTQLIQMLSTQRDCNGYKFDVESIKPDADKTSRLMGVSAYIENGTLQFPQEEPNWWTEFKKELLSFPGSRYKDQVDALTQCINYAMQQ